MVLGASDEALAKRAQQGEREAFLALYDRYLDRVYNRVKSRVPPQHVEDVTQDIFIAVLRSLNQFEQRSRFSTWLYTIVNRHIADFYRHRQHHQDSQSVGLEIVEQLVAETPDQAYGDEQALLQGALQALPPHYQEVILMRFADGMTFAEIAQERGQSLEAIKSLYRRAIQALRDKMGGNEDA